MLNHKIIILESMRLTKEYILGMKIKQRYLKDFCLRRDLHYFSEDMDHYTINILKIIKKTKNNTRYKLFHGFPNDIPLAMILDEDNNVICHFGGNLENIIYAQNTVEKCICQDIELIYQWYNNEVVKYRTTSKSQVYNENSNEYPHFLLMNYKQYDDCSYDDFIKIKNNSERELEIIKNKMKNHDVYKNNRIIKFTNLINEYVSKSLQILQNKGFFYEEQHKFLQKIQSNDVTPNDIKLLANSILFDEIKFTSDIFDGSYTEELDYAVTISNKIYSVRASYQYECRAGIPICNDLEITRLSDSKESNIAACYLIPGYIFIGIRDIDFRNKLLEINNL
jgi:hypothetical protein